MKVTVISSNFIALMLILNMAMNIHLTVRYLQIKKGNSQFSNKKYFRCEQKNDATNSI